MVNNIVSFLKAIRRLIRESEGIVIDIVSSTVPWCAPIVPAAMAYHSMVNVIGFAQPVALAAAASIEGLGLASTSTALSLWDFNHAKRKTDRDAPFVLAVITTGVYLITVILTNILLDTAPIIHRVAKALLSMLSVIGALVLAVRSQHARQINEIEVEKEERRKERQATRQNTGKTGKVDSVRPVYRDWRELPYEERTICATLTSRAIQKRFTVPERTARNWKRQGLKLAAERNNAHHTDLNPLPLAE